MFGVEFDWMIGIGSLICGLLVMTGHGDFLMKGGNSQARKATYDEKKMMTPTGIAFLLIGVLTIINIYMTQMWAHILYLVLMLAVFVGLILYFQLKCKK